MSDAEKIEVARVDWPPAMRAVLDLTPAEEAYIALRKSPPTDEWCRRCHGPNVIGCPIHGETCPRLSARSVPMMRPADYAREHRGRLPFSPIADLDEMRDDVAWDCVCEAKNSTFDRAHEYATLASQLLSASIWRTAAECGRYYERNGWLTSPNEPVLTGQDCGTVTHTHSNEGESCATF